eukprot:scaffold14762_cov210-Skeletonema_marinoi.AAC.12
MNDADEDPLGVSNFVLMHHKANELKSFLPRMRLVPNLAHVLQPKPVSTVTAALAPRAPVATTATGKVRWEHTK